MLLVLSFFFFFFNDTATTEIYTLSLHDALPISLGRCRDRRGHPAAGTGGRDAGDRAVSDPGRDRGPALRSPLVGGDGLAPDRRPLRLPGADGGQPRGQAEPGGRAQPFRGARGGS